MKNKYLLPLCFMMFLCLISCGKGMSDHSDVVAVVEEEAPKEIPQQKVSIDTLRTKKEVKPVEVSSPSEGLYKGKDYVSMSFYNSEEKIQYGLVDLHNSDINDWGRMIIAVIGKDTLEVPYPKAEVGDLTYSTEGDLNSNGYNDLLIISGSLGSCCYPDYTIASFDGNKFRLTQTLEWVMEHEIETFDKHSLITIQRESKSSNVKEQFNETLVYEYKGYALKEVTKKASKHIKADRELTVENVYDSSFPKTTMYNLEVIEMPYVVNEKDSLRILAAAGPGRGLLSVYLFDDHKKQHYELAFQASRVGVLPIMHEGYPLLVVNMDEIYTKDGEYTGDVEAIYKLLAEKGYM